MEIMNLSLGKTKVYCRNCLTERNEFSSIGILRTNEKYTELIDQFNSNIVSINYIKKGFGLIPKQSLKLYEHYFLVYLVTFFRHFAFSISKAYQTRIDRYFCSSN